MGAVASYCISWPPCSKNVEYIETAYYIAQKWNLRLHASLQGRTNINFSDSLKKEINNRGMSIQVTSQFLTSNDPGTGMEGHVRVNPVPGRISIGVCCSTGNNEYVKGQLENIKGFASELEAILICENIEGLRCDPPKLYYSIDR
jgi:hypothetical protein